MRKWGITAALLTMGAMVSALLMGAGPANAAPTSWTTWVSVLTPSGSAGTKVLDIRDASTADRGVAQIYDYRGTGNQIWTMTAVGQIGGYTVYTLKNQNSQRCLDKSLDTADADGNKVYQYGCINGASNQQWKAVPVVSGNNWVELVNVSDGRCLDVLNKSFTNLQPLQVWGCSGAWNQRWNIYP